MNKLCAYFCGIDQQGQIYDCESKFQRRDHDYSKGFIFGYNNIVYHDQMSIE